MRVYTTQQLVDYGLIPAWLGESIAHTCKCGCPILNNDILTFRWCANPSCYYHMQHKADEMFKHLRVKGIGPATCLSMLKQHDLTNHFQLIPYVIGDYKPSVHLWEIADMAGIHTYGSQYWKKALSGKRNFQEYFDSTPYIPTDITAKRGLLISAEKYFSIKAPLASRSLYIMIHGSVPGFANKNMFVDKCNSIIGKYINVMSVGPVGYANYCVTEDLHSMNRKMVKAHENNIPIVTTSEFLSILTSMVVKLIEDGVEPIS